MAEAPLGSATREGDGIAKTREALEKLVAERKEGPASSEGRITGLWNRLRGVRLPDIPSGVGETLGKAGEAALKNKVTGILYSAGESYLNKFDPRGKDAKAWALGIAGGAGSVIAFAEFGATLGLSPALRGITAAASIHGSNFLYDRLHGKYIGNVLGGGDKAPYLKESVDRSEVRKKVIDLEKSIAGRKLTGQAFIDEYKSQLEGVLAPYVSEEAYLSPKENQELAQRVVERLVKLGTDYAVVNSTARSLAAGMAAGSFTAALGEVGVRALAKGTLGTLGEHFGVIGGGAPQTPGGPPLTAVTETATSQTAGVAVGATETPTPTAAGPTFTPTPTEAPTFTPTTTVAAGGQLPTETPTATLTPTETAAPLPTETTTPTTIPTVTSTPTPEVTPTVPTPPTTELPADLKDKLNALEASQEYKTEIAAEVGKYLPARDDVVASAIKAKDILPAEVDSASFEAGKEAALRIMEEKGNEVFENAARTVLENNPDADLSQVAEAAQKAYADWLSTDAAQTQIAEAAQNAVADNLQIENVLAEKVTDGLSSHTDWFVDAPLERGVTLGKILDLTWTPADAPVMGANIAANYDMLTDMWANMAKVHPDLLGNGSFPVSLSELNDLVARAEAGDEQAMRKLRKALHWIPAGAKFRAVAASASRQVLKAVA